MQVAMPALLQALVLHMVMALLPMLALPKLALSVVVSMVVALPKLMQLTMTTSLRATLLVLPCVTTQVSPLLDVWLVPPTSEPWLGQVFNITTTVDNE